MCKKAVEIGEKTSYNLGIMEKDMSVMDQVTLTPKKSGHGWYTKERTAFTALPLTALVVTLVAELFNHKTFTNGPASLFDFILHQPLALLVNVLIVLVTLSPALFFRRRFFWCIMVSLIWLVAGGVNGFILLNRMTPFTTSDLTVLNTGLDTLPNYLSTGYIVLLVICLAAAVLGLAVLFWRGPRSTVPLRRRLKAGALGLLLSGALLGGAATVSFAAGQLSTTFANLAFAYEDYGFSYCFLQTWLNKGIRRPAGYDESLVLHVTDQLVPSSDPALTDVNVIYVQLESFINPAQIQGLTLSVPAAPNWEALQAEYSTGYLTVPVVGAGTANTECEVLTGMSTRLFGPGEYPYETCLMDQTAESTAYILKDLGYGTHAIHNHRATFYSRNQVYANLGFDDFTALEYMPQASMTPKNWAKDSILTSQILKALDATENQTDFVFTVSVQGHGKYPVSQVLEDPAITVVDCPDEDYRYAIEYYVNQIREMDLFVGNLVNTLAKREEKTVLVLYGDHLPALNLRAEDMVSSTLYRTEYVIWDNLGLARVDQDLAAYQLSAAVLERLGISDGILNAYHQQCAEENTYRSGLQTLQYDMLYGQRYAWGGSSPYTPTDMQMGVAPIEVTRIVQTEEAWLIIGDNFSPYCEARNTDGDLLETSYISSHVLRVLEDPGTDNPAELTISVVDKHREILSDTE